MQRFRSSINIIVSYISSNFIIFDFSMSPSFLKNVISLHTKMISCYIVKYLWLQFSYDHISNLIHYPFRYTTPKQYLLSICDNVIPGTWLQLNKCHKVYHFNNSIMRRFAHQASREQVKNVAYMQRRHTSVRHTMSSSCD